MILLDYGITRNESEIYECCQTNSDGTLARFAVECLESFGMHASMLRSATLEELNQFVSESQTHAIAFINVAPLLGKNLIHAVIVTRIDEQASHIHVIDPAHPPNGQRIWALGQFQLAWQLARFQIILIRAAASS